jgi:hypothetical protein
MAKSLEDMNTQAGYDDVVHTIRQHGEYIKIHGAVQTVSNPTGNRQTEYKASAVAAMFEGMNPGETFEQILERVHQYAG